MADPIVIDIEADARQNRQSTVLSWSQSRTSTMAPPSLPPGAGIQNTQSSQGSFTPEAGARAPATPRGRPLSDQEKLILTQICVSLADQYGEGQTKFFTMVVGQLSTQIGRSYSPQSATSNMKTMEAARRAQLHEAGSGTEIRSDDWAIAMDQWIQIVDGHKERVAAYQAATNALKKKHTLSVAQRNLLRQSFSTKRAANAGLIEGLPESQEWPADSLRAVSEPASVRKKPQRQRRGRFEDAEAIASIEASKAFSTYIATLTRPSDSDGSRGRGSSEPLQKRLKIIEERQDQLLGTVEELLNQVREVAVSPMRPTLPDLPLRSIERSPSAASFTTATSGLQEHWY